MKKFIFCILCSIFLLFSSCSDTAPILDTVKVMVLYDYTTDRTLPKMRMGVFVQLSSHPVRLENLTIDFSEEGHVWKIDDPATIKNMQNGQTWLGSSHLVPVPGTGFSSGTYRVTYADLASRETELYFTLPILPSVDMFDQSLYTEKNIAVFDAVGNLLYHGLHSNMSSDEIILQQYPNAVSVRTVLFSSDGVTGVVQASRLLNKDIAEQTEEYFNTNEGISE